MLYLLEENAFKYSDSFQIEVFLYDENDENNMTPLKFESSRFDEDFGEYLRDHLEDEGVIFNPEKVEAEKEAERQKTRDAEYWPDPEEKKKQIELPLQEHKIRFKITKS